MNMNMYKISDRLLQLSETPYAFALGSEGQAAHSARLFENAANADLEDIRLTQAVNTESAGEGFNRGFIEAAILRENSKGVYGGIFSGLTYSERNGAETPVSGLGKSSVLPYSFEAPVLSGGFSENYGGNGENVRERVKTFFADIGRESAAVNHSGVLKETAANNRVNAAYWAESLTGQETAFNFGTGAENRRWEKSVFAKAWETAGNSAPETELQAAFIERSTAAVPKEAARALSDILENFGGTAAISEEILFTGIKSGIQTAAQTQTQAQAQAEAQTEARIGARTGLQGVTQTESQTGTEIGAQIGLQAVTQIKTLNRLTERAAEKDRFIDPAVTAVLNQDFYPDPNVWRNVKNAVYDINAPGLAGANAVMETEEKACGMIRVSAEEKELRQLRESAAEPEKQARERIIREIRGNAVNTVTALEPLTRLNPAAYFSGSADIDNVISAIAEAFEQTAENGAEGVY